MSEAAKTCCVPGCGRSCDKGQHARGMCGSCYQEARRAVRVKETTWLELQQLGLCYLPERKRAPKKETAFCAALRQARESQSKGAE